ncbi:MAG: histidine--tRNA ligase [bacterium]
MEKIKAVRGTRDILPEEAGKWQFLESKAREFFSIYNYKEIRTPVFEDISLFIRGVGQGTDIVRKEMYVFEDKKGRKLCLRPEGTAGVMRAFIEHNLGIGNPVNKLFYIGPMFRYERPQAGRYRQHTQIGVELIGSLIPCLDAEVISLAYNYLKDLGLKEIHVHLNSVGCSNCRGKYKDILKEELHKRLNDFCPDCQDRFKLNILRVFDCKVLSCKELLSGTPVITDFICPDCGEHLREVEKYLNLLNVDYERNPRLVRGLDYYTRTTFEIIFLGLGAQNALAAGGRYDKLISELGGDDVPGIGFAAGLDRIIMAVDESKIPWPAFPAPDIYFVPLGAKAYDYLFPLCQKFRLNGLKCEIGYDEKRLLKNHLKEADKLKAKKVVIIGDRELDRGIAIIKMMDTGEQKEIKLEELSPGEKELEKNS